MKKTSIPRLILILMVPLAITLQQCKSGQSSSSKKMVAENLISYDEEIKPIMETSCTPCHFPEKGKKTMLDTYETTSRNIKEIIARIEMDPAEKGFMPFKSKKPPLTEDQIAKFKTWMQQGMPD